MTEEFSRHGGMAPPAQKGHIRPEPHIIRPVDLGVRSFGMTDEADRPVVHLYDPAIAVEHDMRIDPGITLLAMTCKTERTPVPVRPASQQPVRFGQTGPAMGVMAGQTPDFTPEKGKGLLRSNVEVFGRNHIDRVMIPRVCMAPEADH